MIPRPSDGPVSVTVCGVFQLGSTLGTRKIFTKQINTSDLSDDAHSKCRDEVLVIVSKADQVIKLSVGDAGSSSLLLVLGRYFSRFSTFSSFEVWTLYISPMLLDPISFTGRVGLRGKDKFWIRRSLLLPRSSHK